MTTIDTLVGPATPHFAYQLRARVRELIEDLPADNPTRRYGEEQMELLDRLGRASSKAEEGPPEPRTRIGWERDPQLRAGVRPAPAAAMTYAGASVLVTGGSRGIGREIALRFAAEGAARVAIGYLRNDRAAEAVADELRERRRRAGPRTRQRLLHPRRREVADARPTGRRSSTTRRPASSARRSRPRTSTGTGR